MARRDYESSSYRRWSKGTYLSEKNEVIMLDVYEPQVDTINQNGITVLEPDGTEKCYKNIRAMKSGTCDAVADLVIVFVKSTFSEAALKENSVLFGKDTIVMTLQNGAGNDRKLAKYVKPENIIIGTSKHNSVNLGGGKVSHSGNGMTTIGSNCGKIEALGIIEKLFSDSGFDMEILMQ